MEILELIDKLESLVAQSSRVPLVDKVMLSSEELLNVLDEIRLSVPEDIKRAQQVLKEKDFLLAQAQKEAAYLLANAEASLQARIQESDLVRRAEERARAVLSDAQAKAQAILAEADNQVLATRMGADEYALDVLSRLEAQLSSFINSVQKGIEALERERAKA